jgi:hypothetical protein
VLFVDACLSFIFYLFITLDEPIDWKILVFLRYRCLNNAHYLSRMEIWIIYQHQTFRISNIEFHFLVTFVNSCGLYALELKQFILLILSYKKMCSKRLLNYNILEDASIPVHG